jgi:hypothetical protein
MLTRLALSRMAKKKPTVDDLLRERLRELGAIGGKAAAKKLTSAERKQKARAAAAAHWKKKGDAK